MCDDITENENQAWTVREMRRREVVTKLSVGAAIAVLPGCAPDPAAPPTASAKSPASATIPAAARDGESAGSATAPLQVPAAKLATRRVTVATPDGKADAFFVAPREGKHPGVIMWPDIAGLREAYEAMAKRLAETGYAVIVPNQYYRSAPAPVLANFAEWRTDAGREKLKPMIEKLTPDTAAKDAAAFVSFLDEQPEVDTKKKIATSGYCMGGPFAIRTAAAVPARVGAVASFHGASLTTDKPDSPHLLIAKTQASFLIAIAQNDDERDGKSKTILAEAAKAAKRPAEIEVYPAQHGFCAIDTPVYAKDQAERAWARMLATFQSSL
jgi:carboxymethylenebutenolidase